jgi:hypothetical protein
VEEKLRVGREIGLVEGVTRGRVLEEERENKGGDVTQEEDEHDDDDAAKTIEEEREEEEEEEEEDKVEGVVNREDLTWGGNIARDEENVKGYKGGLEPGG